MHQESADPLEPLKELIRRWRNQVGHIHHLCADEIEPLLPALEAAFAEVMGENTRLDTEWKQTHEWNNKLVAEHYALKEKWNTFREDADRVHAENRALKEPMACGHPKACWVDGKVAPNDDGQIDTESEGHCTACEHERLAVAAALRDLANEDWAQHTGYYTNILSRIPPADQKALDAYVQEKVDRERDRLRAIENQKWEFWLTGLCEDIRSGKEDDVDIRVLAAVRERVDRAVLAEHDQCCQTCKYRRLKSARCPRGHEMEESANRAKVETKT